ncbi:hypothetical protein Aduo_015846 [Ancylostoma duodenale]
MSFSLKAPLYFFLLFLLRTGKSSPTCSPDQFACLDGPKCIPILWLCDGARDCPDGSDETHTQCHPHLTNITCLGNQPDCLQGGFPRCIPNEWLCDGHWDCDHGEDEANCNGSGKKVDDDCGPSQFRCGKRCIFRNQKCDELPNCKDGASINAGLCLQPPSSKSKAKAGPPKSAVYEINNNSSQEHQEVIARKFSTVLSTTSTHPSVESGEEVGSTTAPGTTSFTSGTNEQTTTSPSAPTISLMKSFSYSFVTPSPSTEIDITQPQSPAPRVSSDSSSGHGLTSLAKVFRTNFSMIVEPPDIRRVPEKNVVGSFKREVGMQSQNETGLGEVVYDVAEEKSGPGHETADVVQGKPEVAVERIQPELQPVKSVVGEPIRPVNL